MATDGVVEERMKGRKAWYSVSELRFRFWYEYRSAPREQTRVGWLSRLIEEVMTTQERVSAWISDTAVAWVAATLGEVEQTDR